MRRYFTLDSNQRRSPKAAVKAVPLALRCRRLAPSPPQDRFDVSAGDSAMPDAV